MGSFNCYVNIFVACDSCHFQSVEDAVTLYYETESIPSRTALDHFGRNGWSGNGLPVLVFYRLSGRLLYN
jgi:hypothetical protein